MIPKLASSLAVCLWACALPCHGELIPVPRATLEAIHKDNETAKAELAKREKQLSDTQAALATAFQVTIPAKQKEIDAQADAKAKAEEADRQDKLTIASKNRVIKWLSFPPAILAGVLVLWGCLKLEVPNLSPPWGMAATFGLPLLAFGGVMALMRFV